jgi:4'-phosphopantetheinyl transferase
MAPSAEPLMDSKGLSWLSEPPFAQAPPAIAATVVLVCDVASKPWTDLAPTRPTASDRRDARRPGSAPRTFFAVRRGLSRRLLAWRIGCGVDDVEIGYDGDGAPRATSHPGWFVSTASRGSLTALAVGPHPVGVDVEPTTEVDPIAAVLHTDESRALAETDIGRRADRFLRFWTMKEAYLKSLGCGFTRDPASIAVCDGAYPDASIRDDGIPIEAACAQWRAYLASTALAAVFYRA